MCMALAALFSIVVAGSMAYKMMVKHEPIDIMKLFKPLVVSVILCWWYPPADTGITNNGSSWCVLDFLSYIPNCIGSYTTTCMKRSPHRLRISLKKSRNSSIHETLFITHYRHRLT